MAHSDISLEPHLSIEGLQESIITSYFTTINQEKFSETAALFVEDGELIAPFEEPIRGKSAIASYLLKQAKGMHLYPQEVAEQGLNQDEENLKQFRVIGKVKTALFSVRVAWNFSLNLNHQITKVKVKLLASPQELLNLQTKNNQL